MSSQIRVRSGIGRALALATLSMVGLTLVGGGAGCARRPYAQPMQVTAPDPAPGPASSHRQFQPMVASYENTAVVAWSTRFAFVDLPNQCDPGRPIVEPLIFVGNVLSLPVAVVVEPPLARQHAWRPVGGVGPTQTAVPPTDEVVVVTQGAIVPALRPGVGMPGPDRGSRTRRDDAAWREAAWRELVPVRTETGMSLVEPGQEPPPTDPPATQTPAPQL